MSFSDFFWLLSAPTWVSNSQRIMMSFNDASKLFPAPVGRATPNVFWTSLDDSSPLLESPLPWACISGYIARKSGSKVVGTWDPKPRSWNLEPRGGGAEVFLALGQGSFHGTTPVEFDKYSKAFISKNSSSGSSNFWNSSKL
ncbi:hypothetical protein DY000_02040950 [Brassica cretica]|uniref:Uncharacterized protein n=1 Tax=Brassica cretica TaxID=69181 RepID=A0ABQ7B9M4_BRACR|nr:hypothetical protein DY000_02040950 [Brassica cretica]